jgi:hypothetical protein
MNKQILANLALKINVKAGFSTDHYAFLFVLHLHLVSESKKKRIFLCFPKGRRKEHGAG